MKHALRLAVLIASGAIALLTPALAQDVTFADAPLGVVPTNFEPMQTGPGEPGRWQVVEDNGASGGKAVAQVSQDPTENRFPLLVHTPTVPADVEVKTKVKPVSGRVDQAGGLAIRLLDPNNYYLVRANALEGNVRFYKVVGGRREQLASADLPVAVNAWQGLMLRAQGDRFTVSFDGRELFTATDETFRTRRQGRILDQGRQRHALRLARHQAAATMMGEDDGVIGRLKHVPGPAVQPSCSGSCSRQGRCRKGGQVCRERGVDPTLNRKQDVHSGRVLEKLHGAFRGVRRPFRGIPTGRQRSCRRSPRSSCSGCSSPTITARGPWCWWPASEMCSARASTGFWAVSSRISRIGGGSQSSARPSPALRAGIIAMVDGLSCSAGHRLLAIR